MVSFDKNTKNLNIPSSLGNFQSNGGGGGVTPQEVQEMINSSITSYDVDIQEEFNNTNSGVSQNAENIETLSGVTQDILNSLENYATTAVTSAITENVNTLSSLTSGITENVNNLSAATSGIASDLQTLSAYTENIPTGFTIPIASQNELGGIMVGSGLAIDPNGVLSVSGGSDASTVQYLTEDNWPGAYWEVGTGEMNKWGASIRRPDYTEIFETYFNTNECIVMGEGNIGNTGSREGNLTITDENEHIMLDKQGNRYVFKMDFTNGRLYFYHSPDQTGSFYYEGAQGAQYVTGSTTGTVHIELAKVLSGNTWIQKDEILFPKTYFIDNMTDAERVELYNYIKYSGPKISPIAKYCRFFSELDNKDGFMGMCEVYFGRFDSGTYLSFTGSVPSRNSNLLFKVKFNINPNGSIQGKTITEYDLTVHS